MLGPKTNQFRCVDPFFSDKCFVDGLIDNARREISENFAEYKINLEKIFVDKFRTVLAGYDKSFQKLKLFDFQTKLCSTFPIDDVTHSKSNKDFMSPECMREYVQKTIEQHQNLYLQFDWKTTALDSEITLNYDPRKKKAIAIAQAGYQKSTDSYRNGLVLDQGLRIHFSGYPFDSGSCF